MSWQTLIDWVHHYGEPAIFVMVALGVFCLPIPVETLMVFAGSLIYSGKLAAIPTAAAALGGAIVGVTMSYALGRGTDRVLHRYGRIVHLTPERIDRVDQWFEKVGKWSLIMGYFIPGARHLTGYFAGASRLNFAVFALFAYAGAAVWVVVFLTAGYILGDGWHYAVGSLKMVAWIAVAIVVVVLVVAWQIYARREKKKT